LLTSSVVRMSIMEAPQRMFRTVIGVRSFIENSEVAPTPPAALDMCLLDMMWFHRGWVCTLVDLEMPFREIIPNLCYTDRGRFTFRLFVLDDNVTEETPVPFLRGARLLAGRVTHLTFYRDIPTGWTDMDYVAAV
jgi:hypothetical protein